MELPCNADAIRSMAIHGPKLQGKPIKTGLEHNEPHMELVFLVVRVGQVLGGGGGSGPFGYIDVARGLGLCQDLAE